MASDFDSSLPVRTQNPGDVVVKVGDATLPTQQLTVNPDGSVNVADGGNSLTVDATDLDIRDLDSTQDSVEVLQATHDNLNANVTIQVADTDVSNANPVPVSDAGGSLTIDANNLDIRDLVFATDKVDVSGSAVTAVVTATNLDIRDLVFATDKVDVSGSAVTAVVTATDLDIRDLSHTTDSVKVGDGTDFLAVNTDGSINVVLQENPGTEVINYNTAVAVAANATSNHDYTTTHFILQEILVTGTGKMKAEIQVETGAATGTFNTIAVLFNSTAAPNMILELKSSFPIPLGARVRVIRTNRDVASQDVYSSIMGVEV